MFRDMKQYKTALLRQLRLYRGALKATRECERIEALEDVIVNNNSSARDDSSPKYDVVMKEIKDVGEKALQRALFRNDDRTLIKDGIIRSIKWLDIELPVNFSGKGRRKPVDLVGRLYYNNQREKTGLCELKFAKRGDSPKYGLLELITYHYLAKCNYKNLDPIIHRNKSNETEPNFYWREISDTLIFAANKAYWDSWRRSFSRDAELHNEWFSNLKHDLKLDICLFEIDIDLEYFRKIRRDREHYPPLFKDGNNPMWYSAELT